MSGWKGVPLIIGWGVVATMLQLVVAASAPCKGPNCRCDLKKMDGRKVSSEQLFKLREPVILTNLAERWPALQKWKTIEDFSKMYGDRSIQILSNAYLTLNGSIAVDRVLDHVRTGLTASGERVGATVLLFSDYPGQLPLALAGEYDLPRILMPFTQQDVVTVGGLGSGVQPASFHGAGWLGIVAGRKRWFLSNPGTQWPAEFQPIATPTRRRSMRK